MKIKENNQMFVKLKVNEIVSSLVEDFPSTVTLKIDLEKLPNEFNFDLNKAIRNQIAHYIGEKYGLFDSFGSYEFVNTIELSYFTLNGDGKVIYMKTTKAFIDYMEYYRELYCKEHSISDKEQLMHWVGVGLITNIFEAFIFFRDCLKTEHGSQVMQYNSLTSKVYFAVKNLHPSHEDAPRTIFGSEELDVDFKPNLSSFEPFPELNNVSFSFDEVFPYADVGLRVFKEIVAANSLEKIADIRSKLPFSLNEPEPLLAKQLTVNEIRVAEIQGILPIEFEMELNNIMDIKDCETSMQYEISTMLSNLTENSMIYEYLHYLLNQGFTWIQVSKKNLNEKKGIYNGN